MEIEESGEILFEEITRLKWTYQDPEYKVFIMEGNSYRFYDKENNQLIRGEVSKKNQKWIWQLLFSDEILSDMKIDEKKKTIHFQDEGEELDVEIIIGEQLLPEKAIQLDPSGVKYIYFFSSYKKGVEITKKDFDLALPADVEVIDENLD